MRAVFAPFLVELSRGVERDSEPLMLSICTHIIVLGSERSTLKAYPRQFWLAQCREIVDTVNAMDGSVVHLGRCMPVSSGGTYSVSHHPLLMPKLGRGRRHVLGYRGTQNCRDSVAVAGERVLRVNRTRGTPEGQSNKEHPKVVVFMLQSNVLHENVFRL